MAHKEMLPAPTGVETRIREKRARGAARSRSELETASCPLPDDHANLAVQSFSAYLGNQASLRRKAEKMSDLVRSNVEKSLLAQFIVLGRLDAAVLAFAFAIVLLADFLPSAAGNLLIFSLAVVALGTVINGIRRAYYIRRLRTTLSQASDQIAEFGRIDARDDAGPRSR